MTEALSPNEKMQVITTISHHILTTNSKLVNINYENMHYQYMGLCNIKLCQLPYVISPIIERYYKHYTVYENNRVQ